MKAQSPKVAERALGNMIYGKKHKKHIKNKGIKNSGPQLLGHRKMPS